MKGLLYKRLFPKVVQGCQILLNLLRPAILIEITDVQAPPSFFHCPRFAVSDLNAPPESCCNPEKLVENISKDEGKSCGLAVEHSAHDRKVMGLIPVQPNARWKWC